MKLYKKTCKNPKCGKDFLGARTQQYCCPDCRVPTYIPKGKQKPKRTCTVDDVTRKARANGMSYGQYVAMQYLLERENKQ